jgi:hypothetical protein
MRVFYDCKKHPSRLIAEIKDEVRLWIKAGAKSLVIIVSTLVPE